MARLVGARGVVLIATDVFLTLFFHASAQDVIYHGSYLPLQGQHMSEAYRSTVHLGFDVRAGPLVRRTHHWAALVFIGAIVLHLCRIFFTAAFRRPREINWSIGLALLILAILCGFTGYSLPDDLLSGMGIRIAYSVMLTIPWLGTWMAFLIFGGAYPASDITSRLFNAHALIVRLTWVGGRAATVPAVVFPTLAFVLLYAWPAIDRRISRRAGGDPDADHHLLERPRDRPGRTALGVAVLTFYVVLFIAGGQDLISQYFHIQLDTVRLMLRVLLVVTQLAFALLAWKLCHDLATEDARTLEGDPSGPGAPLSPTGTSPADVPLADVPLADVTNSGQPAGAR